MALTTEQKEDLRHAIAEALAVRHPSALSTRQIARAVKKEIPFPFEDAEVDAACEMLRGLGLCVVNKDELGTTKYWTATSQLVLKVERAEI